MKPRSGSRLARAQEVARDAGVEALLVSPGLDLRYLTGYCALPLERLTCLVLPASGEIRIVVPALEEPAALDSPLGSAPVEVITWSETEDPYALVASLLPETGLLAVDDHMWAVKVLSIAEAMPGMRMRPAGTILSSLRAAKDPEEIAALREAAAAIDLVHGRMREWLTEGRTECAVAADIADAMLEAGHLTVDFVIVASGPNGASPHHDVSDRVIRAGDPVVVDIGGTMPSGYCSDCTRTYVVGGPAEEFTAMYEVLLEAQEAALRAVRPGASAESIDAAARDHIKAAGFGDRFIHRTGHGIGLDVHEEPYLVAGNKERLRPGMAFSIEPGIYVPGRHGARIEDIVVVTEDGAERLNRRPYGL